MYVLIAIFKGTLEFLKNIIMKTVRKALVLVRLKKYN